MKTTTRVLVSAILLLCGTAARAQSSVTLYGLIDEGFNFTNNAGKGNAYQMRSGDSAGSRFGIKGAEDLGGGMSAIFNLESGYDMNSGALGQGGRMFGRQAWVGLTSKQAGTVTFGRQYDPTIDMFSAITPGGNWAGDVGATPFDNDNSDWDFRVNNSVKYVSPTIAGFTGEAMYGFSNTAGGFADNRMYSAAGTYQYGGLTAVVAYMKIDNPGQGTSGAVTSDAQFTGASTENIDGGLSYKWDKLTAALTYSHTTVDAPTGNAYLTGDIQPAGGHWNAWKFDNFGVNAQYYVTPDIWLGGAYTFTLGHLDSSVGNYMPRWHQVALEAAYNLSARTTVYIQGAYQHVASAHTGTEFDNAQLIAAAGPSSSTNQMVYRLALMHRF